MTQLSVRQALDLAHSLARAGRLGEAEAIYRRVLESHADQVEALHGLGRLPPKREAAMPCPPAAGWRHAVSPGGGLAPCRE